MLLLGLASIALMTVQPSGTAVLGTYAAVASAVIRLPKRLALAAIIPIIAIVDVGYPDRRRANASWSSPGPTSPTSSCS